MHAIHYAEIHRRFSDPTVPFQAAQIYVQPAVNSITSPARGHHLVQRHFYLPDPLPNLCQADFLRLIQLLNGNLKPYFLNLPTNISFLIIFLHLTIFCFIYSPVVKRSRSVQLAYIRSAMYCYGPCYLFYLLSFRHDTVTQINHYKYRKLIRT
jgi:hypothetical protein